MAQDKPQASFLRRLGAAVVATAILTAPIAAVIVPFDVFVDPALAHHHLAMAIGDADAVAAAFAGYMWAGRRMANAFSRRFAPYLNQL